MAANPLFASPASSSYRAPDLLNASTISASGLEDDLFVDLYYETFHLFHPFILPQHHLLSYAQDPAKAQQLKPVISCLRQIGCLYSSRADQEGHLAHLVQQAANEIAEAKALTPLCPFLCQAYLLQSIALFWSGAQVEADECMKNAINIAVTLGMSRQEFANSYSDVVLAESWRRTWWQLFIVDADYAAIRRDIDFPTRDIPATVDLPCEEHEYKSGVCPPLCSLAMAIADHAYRSSQGPQRWQNMTRESLRLKNTSSRRLRILLAL
jgi:hypothetical protein